MNPITGMLRAAGAMAYFGRRQEVTANNLANINTPGFKADRITATRPTNMSQPVPVEHTDLNQGALRLTGRPLDVALEGPGFLVVSTDRGERLTRGGSLTLDGAGQLLSSEGVPILGEQGPIVITGPGVTIESDGAVSTEGRSLDRLRLVHLPEGARLMKESNGLFRIESGEPEPGAPAKVRQGQLEDPNIDTVGGMIALVEIQRAYGAVATTMKTMDSILGSVTSDVARVS